MYSGAASQGGGWWQGCGVAYGKAEGSADDDREDELKLKSRARATVCSWYTTGLESHDGVGMPPL